MATLSVGLTIRTDEHVSASTRCIASKSPILMGRNDVHSHQRIMDLYDELHPALLAQLHLLGMSREDAEDVIHESFLRLVRHLLNAPSDENVRGWIFRVAYNLCMDVHRARKHYRSTTSDGVEDTLMSNFDPVDPSPDPEAVLIEKQTLEHLDAAVLELTVQQRKCLLLRSEGLRYREIALVLGISVQRASRLLQLGTSHLIAKL